MESSSEIVDNSTACNQISSSLDIIGPTDQAMKEIDNSGDKLQPKVNSEVRKINSKKKNCLLNRSNKSLMIILTGY